MRSTSKMRSARWRDRRRLDVVTIAVDVLPAHRRALEAMGLIPVGYDRHPVAVANAVARLLDAAPAMKAMGDALYPDWPEEEAEVENETPSPASSGENGG